MSNDLNPSVVYATWIIELNCECPKCFTDVNLLATADFWDGRRLDIGEHGTKRSKGVDAQCPECLAEIKVDLQW